MQISNACEICHTVKMKYNGHLILIDYWVMHSDARKKIPKENRD